MTRNQKAFLAGFLVMQAIYWTLFVIGKANGWF